MVPLPKGRVRMRDFPSSSAFSLVAQGSGNEQGGMN
jgi:hypothetical protein